MQRFSQLLSEIPKELSLPLQIISNVVNRNATDFNLRTSLNLPRMSLISLGNSQREGLEMALSNAPLTLISGLEGTGKTYIAHALAQVAIAHQKKVLILTKYKSSLDSYKNLAVKPLLLSAKESYQADIKTWLKNHFASTQINYLPLHLLPDPLITQVQNQHLESLVCNPNFLSNLSSIFPDTSPTRIKLLSDRLTKLLPFFKQQLALKQQFNLISEGSISELSNLLSHIPVLGTVSDWQKSELELLFDLVIVEDVHTLNHSELIAIAGITDKLVILGIEESNTPFSQLFNSLSPAYRLSLLENFRLHPEIATPIYEAIRDSYVHTPLQRIHDLPPDGKNRLVWQDIPTNPEGDRNQLEGSELLYFLQSLQIPSNIKVGILAFYESQVQWLKINCSVDWLERVYIGTAEEWTGKECQIMLISCVGYPDRVSPSAICIALTRASEALILFGNQQTWQESDSLLSRLFHQPQLHSNREVSLV